MGSTDSKITDFQTRAVFLTGLTDLGNELLYFYPEIQLGESINHDICLKTMPMACQDGDMLITIIGEYQAVSITRTIPCFENNSFKSKTFAALGLLITKGINPIPYYTLLQNLLEKLEKAGSLNKDALIKSVPKLYHSINKRFRQE